MSIFHRCTWLKWSELVEGYACVKMQFRVCAECGKIQKRSIGDCDQAKVVSANSAINETKLEAGYSDENTN